MNKLSFDIVIFGATGYTGRLVAEHLYERFGARGDSRRGEDGSGTDEAEEKGISWAMAGRSVAKLEKVRAEIQSEIDERKHDHKSATSRSPKRSEKVRGSHHEETASGGQSYESGGRDQIPLITADAADEDSLRRMCRQTRVVISTVGPFALYGELLIKVCAETGTDYCDSTGELPWVARMIEQYEEKARQSGARLVPFCGFDSIPSDLGVWHLQQKAQETYGRPATEVKMCIRGIKSAGMSGGTAASMMNVMREASRDRAVRRSLADPYLLCPGSHNHSEKQPNQKGPRLDRDFDSWTAPFLMSVVNTRVVFRSNALSGMEYGKDFRYREVVCTGRGFAGWVRAAGLSGGTALMVMAGSIGPIRRLFERFVLPSPGQGPDLNARKKGFFNLRFAGKTERYEAIETEVKGSEDPGYGTTARMLAESALCLAENSFKSDNRTSEGGFWTPATLLGNTLIERLERYAGMEFLFLSKK